MKEIWWEKFRLWDKVMLLCFGILLFVSGLGMATQRVEIWGVAVASFFLLLTAIRRKIELPKRFLPFLAFFALLSASLFWSQRGQSTLEYCILLAGGGAFWVLFYNLGEDIARDFEKVLIILAVVFGFSYLASRLLPSEMPFKPWTLYLPTTSSQNHNHLGDLWAVILVVLVNRVFTKPKWWHWALGVLGVYFLAISLSRSAYVALGIGIFYLSGKSNLSDKIRKISIFLLVLTAGLFLYAGFFKSTIFSRPYFEQVVWGLQKWPFGVGVGNFGYISTDPQSPWWNGPRTGVVSSLTHNIILEMVAGIGYLGLLFAVWLAYEIWDLLKNKNVKPLFAAVFLAITANFMFDTTYYIPTMLWLWFASLGLAHSGEKN